MSWRAWFCFALSGVLAAVAVAVFVGGRGGAAIVLTMILTLTMTGLQIVEEERPGLDRRDG